MILSLGVVALAACSDDVAQEPAPSTVPAALTADLQAMLDEDVASGLTPGAVLRVTEGDGATWSTAAGVSELAHGTAMGPNDRFRAGSTLKTFVATAVLQAVEAGKLKLDDVLTDHLPPSVTQHIPNASSIQIRMLLEHRSGIAEWEDGDVDVAIVMDPTHVWSLTEILGLVASKPAVFQPGERFSYSNTNYNLLGEILGGIYGTDWREVIREHVFARAGLRDTLLPAAGDLECPAPCAHGYVAVENELLDLSRVDPSMAGAAGGHALITTTADFTRFLQQLRNGEMFERPETLAEMFTFLPAPDPEERLTGYGFGVMQLESDGITAIGHLGGTAGYQSFMLYVPATDRYLSGSINQLGSLGPVLGPILARVATP